MRTSDANTCQDNGLVCCIGPVHVPFYIGFLRFWRDQTAPCDVAEDLAGGHDRCVLDGDDGFVVGGNLVIGLIGGDRREFPKLLRNRHIGP